MLNNIPRRTMYVDFSCDQYFKTTSPRSLRTTLRTLRLKFSTTLKPAEHNTPISVSLRLRVPVSKNYREITILLFPSVVETFGGVLPKSQVLLSGVRSISFP